MYTILRCPSSGIPAHETKCTLIFEKDVIDIDKEQAKGIAYRDISAAFRWYLDNMNEGRGLILAGFSQGAEMCLELLKEYYG